MSLYNMVRGASVTAPICFGMLGVKPGDIPRLRDAWLADDGETITILTRTGGGNREHYQDENFAMTEVSGYKYNEDDDFDSTFAHFVYDVPDQFAEDVKLIVGVTTRIGKGAGSRGPGAMIAALDGEDTPDHGLTPESPEVVAMGEAFDRIVAATT